MKELNFNIADINEILEYWGTLPGTGLETAEAVKRLALCGENKIIELKAKSPWLIFLEQFNNFMIYVLIGACLVSVWLGEWQDAVAIMAIVVLNGFLGFIQEYKAERSLKALKNLSAPRAMVLRDGKMQDIDASRVVPGDILALEAGDRVAADARVLETVNLRVDESILTGESHPVDKDKLAPVNIDTPLAERKNYLYAGTKIVYGRGKAVVITTGMRSEFGKIAHLLQGVEKEHTPLQRRLEKVGRLLVYICLAICLLVFVLGLLRGGKWNEMFLTAVSLAVAAIPEGLPAIVTVVLALGVQRLVRKNALIRKLPAVETLGSTSIICSDKTGTLTQNQMTIRRVYSGEEEIELTGSGYEPAGEFLKNGATINPSRHLDIIQTLRLASLCNNAQLSKNSETGSWQITGDPTEGALLVAAAKAGIWRKDLEEYYEYTDEISFDSVRKRMSVLFKRKDTGFVFTKGSPEIILDLCDKTYKFGQAVALTPAEREKILKINERFAQGALRVLAVAYKELPADELDIRSAGVEKNLVFAGLLGMIDPPRPEVKQAVAKCKSAGIKVVMITGDQKDTAVAIARELGILEENGLVLQGADLDKLSDAELEKVVDNVQVFARVASEHKLKIIQALKNKDHVIAMTGDGVNDAPAVKEADIGMAMGITGTDVTKEAADLVLLDDNFATIVSAVEEGRGIYANIKKFVYYLLSCNFGEILTMLGGLLIGVPVPLLPIQILWVNLVTDGLPALALGVEPVEKEIMTHRPRPAKEKLLTRNDIFNLLGDGLVIGGGSILAFVIGYYVYKLDLGSCRVMAFCTLSFTQMAQVFNCRSWRVSIFRMGFFSNFYLVVAVFSSIVLQLAVIYWPLLRPVFKTMTLGGPQWFVVIGISLTPLLVKELVKMNRRQISKYRSM